MRHSISRRALMAGAAAAAPGAGQTLVRLPRKVRVGLVGLVGHTGEILGELPRLPDVELAAVSETDPRLLEAFGRRAGMASVPRYADHARLLEAEKPDLVAVCTPNGGRAAVIIDCLRRGCHVIAEKPLALTAEELAAVRSARESAGTGLSMLLPMRFSPPYLALRQIVESGEIGEVCQIASQKSYQAGDRPAWMRNRETYGGTIPWIGIHMIDLMRWTSGREFREAFSWTAHIAFPELGDMENVTASLFRLDNGGLGALRMDYLRPPGAGSHGDDRLRLAGTKGVAEYQAATGVTVLAGNRPPRRIETLPEAQSVFVDFLEAVYLNRPAALSLGDIYRVNEITIAAQRSAETRAAVAC